MERKIDEVFLLSEAKRPEKPFIIRYSLNNDLFLFYFPFS